MLEIGKMKPDSISVGRNEESMRRLERHLLRLGHGRDQEAGAERAGDEQRERHQQRQPVAAHRQSEQHHRARMISAADTSEMKK